jgi:hypothetical protein
VLYALTEAPPLGACAINELSVVELVALAELAEREVEGDVEAECVAEAEGVGDGECEDESDGGGAADGARAELVRCCMKSAAQTPMTPSTAR